MHVRSVLFSTALVVGLLAYPCRGAFASEEIDSATAALDRLEKALKSRKSINETLISGLQEVHEHYVKIQPPAAPELEEVPAEADDIEKKAIAERNKKAQREYETLLGKYEREAGRFKKDARGVYVKAFKLVYEDKNTKINRREDVNIEAVQILGSLADSEETATVVARSIIKAMEQVLFKAKNYDVTDLLFEKAFGALGTLNDEDALKWLLKEFTHTRSSPPKEVSKLVAAHKAMVLFKDTPGKLKYAIVDEMVKQYAGVESQAEQSSNDPKLQEKKRFWDRIKTDAIRVIQYFAAEPKDEEGQLLARMDDFQAWFRDNDNPRKPPWKTVEPQKQ